MTYRHEWKHVINASDAAALRTRLRCVMQQDPYAEYGRYHIRSLYFDTLRDSALREKIDGVNRREKFRLRMYNTDTSLIRIEKKAKCSNLCAKSSDSMTEAEVQRLLTGDLNWMTTQTDRPVVQQLYSKMRGEGLMPKTIIDYTREPFIYAPGNVRVTLDSHIRTGLSSTDFLNPNCITVPVGGTETILEVKWDEYLPDVIRSIVQLTGRQAAAFSKYAAGRIYG